jgi:hypothetical protein
LPPVVSRITPFSNPRILLIVAIGLLFLAAAAAVFALLGPLPGLLAGAAALIACWILFGFLRRQLSSRIQTGAEGISFNLPGDDKRFIPWEDVRMAGMVKDPGRGTPRRKLFVYKEEGDILLLIPDEFSEFDALLSEIRSKTKFHEIALPPGGELKDALQRLLESC